MAPLMRPSPEANLHPELMQETVLEQKILSLVEDLKTELGGLRGQLRDMRTVLLGSGDGVETPFGRLPVVEGKISNIEGRLGKIELQALQLQLIGKAGSSAGHWIFAIVGLVIGSVLGAWIISMITGHVVLK